MMAGNDEEDAFMGPRRPAPDRILLGEARVAFFSVASLLASGLRQSE